MNVFTFPILLGVLCLQLNINNMISAAMTSPMPNDSQNNHHKHSPQQHGHSHQSGTPPQSSHEPHLDSPPSTDGSHNNNNNNGSLMSPQAGHPPSIFSPHKHRRDTRPSTETNHPASSSPAPGRRPDSPPLLQRPSPHNQHFGNTEKPGHQSSSPDVQPDRSPSTQIPPPSRS